MKFRFYFLGILLMSYFNATAHADYADGIDASFTRREIHYIKDGDGGNELRFYLECIIEGIVPNNISLDQALLIACRHGVISDKLLRERVILFLLNTSSISRISASTKDILLDVAIRHFSVSTVRFMLKKKVYDSQVMAGKKMHWKALKTFLPRLPKMFYWNYATYFFSFFKSSLSFLELPINIAYRILPMVLWVLSFSYIACFKNTYKLYHGFLHYEPAIYKRFFMANYTSFLTFVLLSFTFFSFVYLSWKYFRKPNYLILAIIAERDYDTKEQMAMDILAHMNKYGFYSLETGFVLSYNKDLKRLSDIMRMNNRGEDPNLVDDPWYIRLLVRTRDFAYSSSYLYIGVDMGAVSALHMAEKYGLERVTKRLYQEDKRSKGKKLAPAYWIASTAKVPQLIEEDKQTGQVRLLIQKNFVAYLYALSEVFIGSAPFFNEPMAPTDFLQQEELIEEEDKMLFERFKI